MRNSILALLALGSLAGHAFAEQRTWTIARDVYTAEGELIAVRGRIAYVRIDGQVEGIPVERLSAADHAYLDSLELAPVRHGATDDAIQAEGNTAAGGPVFPESNVGVLPTGEERSLVVPAAAERDAGSGGDFAAPAVGEEALPFPPGTEQSPAEMDAMLREYRARSVGETWPGSSQAGSADRRNQRPPQSQQQSRTNRSNANRRDADNEDNDSRRGLFRARRERLRGNSR